MEFLAEISPLSWQPSPIKLLMLDVLRLMETSLVFLLNMLESLFARVIERLGLKIALDQSVCHLCEFHSASAGLLSVRWNPLYRPHRLR